VVGQGIMDTINGKSKDKTSAYEDILGDFINKYIQCALVIKDGRTSTEPKQALYIRAEVDEGKIYISTSAMKTYLKDIKLGVREFESNLHTARDSQEQDTQADGIWVEGRVWHNKHPSLRN
jgi:hypothetical protein